MFRAQSSSAVDDAAAPAGVTSSSQAFVFADTAVSVDAAMDESATSPTLSSPFPYTPSAGAATHSQKLAFVRARYMDVLLPAYRHYSWELGRTPDSIASGEWEGPGGAGIAGESDDDDNDSEAGDVGAPEDESLGIYDHYCALLFSVANENAVRAAMAW